MCLFTGYLLKTNVYNTEREQQSCLCGLQYMRCERQGPEVAWMLSWQQACKTSDLKKHLEHQSQMCVFI